MTRKERHTIMKKKIFSFTLACLLSFGCVSSLAGAAVAAGEYPELLITEISVDQYGDAANPLNKNPKYNSETRRQDADPYEFIEIYNNSSQNINIYDYMVGYQGASSQNEGSFERSVQCYTQLLPGEDWWDTARTSHDSYWKNTEDVRPVNPERSEGMLKPGEVAVIWVYTAPSHIMHCTLEQFRSFWSIPDGVKVFLIDGNNVECVKKFALKNNATATYMIMHQSERFPARRSADITFNTENDNTHHQYPSENFESLEEIISWAVMDFRTEPLATRRAQNGDDEHAPWTVSFIPRSASSPKEENGYKANSFMSYKRMHLSKINEYAEATVGRLTDSQLAAFSKTKTSLVRTEPAKQPVLVNNNERPAIIITEISADQYGASSPNARHRESPSADPFECFEMYNNSVSELNIYDYMLAYQGSSATSVSTYFERSIQEYTPFLPGTDWADAPYTAYDKYWQGSETARPINPEYREGIIKPGEVFVVWCYNEDSHKCQATINEFRQFWNIPDDVKVFLIDGNTSRDKNFNIKNSGTGEYIIIQPSERFPRHRSDDPTYYTETNRSDHYYYDKLFSDLPEVISWAVVDYGCYDPLYSFSENNGGSSSKLNYTLCYSVYNGENEFTNGFTTVTFPTQKRVHLSEINKSLEASHIGRLTESQKTSIAKANGQ